MKTEDLLEKIKQHPAFATILQEDEEKNLKARRVAAAKIQAARQSADKLRKEFQPVEAKKLAAVEKTKAAAEAALQDLLIAKRSHRVEMGTLEADIEKHEIFMRDSSPHYLEDAIRFFRNQLDYLRHPRRLMESTEHVEKNMYTQSVKRERLNNWDAILSAMDYCRDAIKKLESMRFQADIDPADIKKLKDGIPDSQQMSEHSSFFVGRPVDPLPGLQMVVN